MSLFFQSDQFGCYPGRVLVGNTCELIITEAIGTYAVDVSTKLSINSTIWDASIVLHNLETALGKHLAQLLPGNVGTIRNLYILPSQKFNVTIENQLLFADIYFEVPYLNYDRKMVEFGLLRLPFQETRRFSTDDGTLDYSITILGFSLPRRTIEYSNPDTLAYKNFKERMRSLFTGPPFVVFFVSNLLVCVHQKYNASLFFFDNEKLRVISNETGLSFKMAEFVVDTGGFIGVCDYDFRFFGNIKDGVFDLQEDIKFLSTVLNGISVVSVASVFLSYCFFKNLRSPSGVNVLFVSFFLCWFHIVRMLVKILQDIETACLVIGFCRHYTWLSVCCSLCVSAFHQFFFFRGYSPESDDASSELEARSPVLPHFLFSGLLPLVVVSLNAVCLYVILSELQYNPTSCFLSHQISIILSFLAPLAITTIVTFSLKCATLKMLISSNEKFNLKRKRVEFLLLFKFVTIVGVLVVFQVTEWFVNSDNFSFVVDLIISLQGCTVLLVFCCSSHVFQLCKVEGENLSESDSIPSLETEKHGTIVDDQ